MDDTLTDHPWYAWWEMPLSLKICQMLLTYQIIMLDYYLIFLVELFSGKFTPEFIDIWQVSKGGEGIDWTVQGNQTNGIGTRPWLL